MTTTEQKLVKLLNGIHKDLSIEGTIPNADLQTRLDNVLRQRAWIIEQIRKIVESIPAN